MPKVIPETPPDYDRTRILERPDGFYWQATDGGREYGPFASLDAADGTVRQLALAPMRVRRFRLQRATEEEAGWLQRTLDRESRAFGTRVELASMRELRATSS